MNLPASDKKLQSSKMEEEEQTRSEETEAESVLSMMKKLVCCQTDLCQWCCEKLIENKSNNKKLTKADILHPVISQQPVPTRVDTTLPSQSSSRSRSSRLSSSGCYSNWSSSSHNSPVFSSRERTGSDNSYSSRNDSNSSVPDSPASFGKKLTPLIDMKPIEFWAVNRAENVQPRSHKHRLPSESEISIEDLNLDIYETDTSEECLSDEQKLARYKLGQVYFSIQFEIATKSLVVRIIEARDLPLPYIQDTSKQDMAHSNPYIKICLLPDHKDSRKTTVQRKTQDPKWNEAFKFEIPFKDAQRRSLEITVKDFDRFSRHCVIGQATVPLEHINLVRGSYIWKPLTPSVKEEADLGQILLSLNYLPSAGRLNVDVIKAKQVQQTDLIGGSDPYVKVSLCHFEKTVKTRKTSIRKNTIDPVFNETLSFNLTPDVLDECSLVVTVWDYNSKSKDDIVGRIVLGRNPSGREERNHWSSMLYCPRSSVAHWHTLLPCPEMDEKSSTSCGASIIIQSENSSAA